MNILVTGANGQLGSEIRNMALGSRNHYVFSDVTVLPGNDTVNLDITNIDAVRIVCGSEDVDVIVNCAGYTAVDKAEDEPAMAELLNLVAVKNLSEVASGRNATLMHISTDYVFDGTKNDLYIETDKTNPLNEYGKSKLAGEQEALKYSNSLVCRLSWVIGEGQQNFLFKLSGWLKNNKVIKVSGDEVSVPCFSFDIANTVIKALDKGLIGLYHLTNSGKASRYELAKEFVKLKNFDNEIVPVPMASFNSKVQRPLVTAMSNAKISKELNITIPEWNISLKKLLQNNF